MTEHQEILKATILWLNPSISQSDLEVELAWAENEMVLDKKGYITWRLFTLGRKLMLSLGECQNWRCCYCYRKTVEEDFFLKATIEHIVRKADGGTDHPDNLVMACLGCNTKKGFIESCR